MKDFNISGGKAYLSKQIKKHLNLLYDLSETDIQKLDFYLPEVLPKVYACWSAISDKYFVQDGQPVLDIDNSNQYAQFLLIFARHLSVNELTSLADKVFNVNKMLNSCDIYHEIALPATFCINHTLGIIIGRAQLGERLYLSQNCTIGGNPSNASYEYPVLGDDNYLMANVTVIGKVKTGQRVLFGAGSYVKDIEIPSNSFVFGKYPHNTIKDLKAESFKITSPFYQN